MYLRQRLRGPLSCLRSPMHLYRASLHRPSCLTSPPAKPRFDQSTFFGRLRHFMDVTDFRCVPASHTLLSCRLDRVRLLSPRCSAWITNLSPFPRPYSPEHLLSRNCCAFALRDHLYPP